LDEPEEWLAMTGHTNASAAGGNKQSRVRVCCPIRVDGQFMGASPAPSTRGVTARHSHKRSSLITTNTAFSDWGNILYNTTIAEMT
jgi:hypothetical protein